MAATVGGIFVAWGVAQFPYLIPPDITIANAASPPSVMGPLLTGTVIGIVIFLPSLWLLFYLFKERTRPAPPMSAEALMKTLPPTKEAEDAAGANTYAYIADEERRAIPTQGVRDGVATGRRHRPGAGDRRAAGTLESTRSPERRLSGCSWTPLARSASTHAAAQGV